jgi:hypothetical protein
MPTTTPALQSAFPTGVFAFATEHGVANYLPAVWEMTKRVFSNRPFTSILEDDPELPDWRAIVIDVDVTALKADQILAAQQQWTASLCRSCPATHIHFFRLNLWASE